MAIRAVTRRSTVRALAALGGGEIVARAVAFFTATLLARRLGPTGFGVLGFATALSSYFALAVTGGLNDVGARRVAHDPAEARPVYASLLAMRFGLALAAMATLGAVAWILPRPLTDRVVLALCGLSFFSLAVDPGWAYRALERSGTAALGGMAAQMLALVGVALFVTGPADVVRVPVVQFAGELLVGLALALPLMGFASPPAAAWRQGRALFREAAPILLGRGMRTLIVTFDVVLLGFLTTTREVGVYSAAYRVSFLVLSLAIVVHTAYLPVFARALRRGPDELRRMVDEALASAAFIGAPLVIGGIVTAGPLLAFLFGSEYAAGARALQWLLVSLAFLFVHVVLHGVYLVTGQAKLETAWFACGAAVNIVANLWLIPRYGIAGAAAATALAEAVIAVGGIRVLRVGSALEVGRVWLRPTGAAIVMGVAVWFAGTYVSLPAQIGIGIVVYGGVVIGLAGGPMAARRCMCAGCRPKTSARSTARPSARPG